MFGSAPGTIPMGETRACASMPSADEVSTSSARERSPRKSAGVRVETLQVRPDADLLLFLYGMSQQLGVRG